MLSLLLLTLLALATVTNAFYVIVPTGNVGVQTILGVIQSDFLNPGIQFYVPGYSKIDVVDVNSQTDPIELLECKTSDKRHVSLKGNIKNQLPKDSVVKVYSHFQKSNVNYDVPLLKNPAKIFLMEYCSQVTGEELRTNYAELNDKLSQHLAKEQENRPELNGESTGVKVLMVFIDIPQFSAKVEENYQEISIQQTAKQAEKFRQETELKRKETENLLAELEAEKQRIIAATENKQRIEKEEADAKVAKIQADSLADQKRISADATSYANHKLADDNKNLLTPSYIEMRKIESFGCQNVIHYASKDGNLPNFLPDHRVSETG